MANNFDSNITRKLIRVFLEEFECARTLSKNVNTQLLDGKFNPSSGTTVDFKRPTDYTSVRTPAGDLTGQLNTITTGKATGTVQDYFSVAVDYSEADQAIKMDQINELLRPMATRIVTDLELDFGNFMRKNAGLLAGTYGTPVTTWDHIANGSATMKALGIPADERWCAAVNPFTETTLASNQRSLGAGGSAGGLISEAHKRAILSDGFAGMRVMTSTALGTVTSDSPADRAGTLTANPDATYLTAKDTMQQTLAVTAFGANLVVKAGEVIQITGRNRLNLSTRQPMIDATGANIVYTGTVVADVTLGAAGEGNIVVTGPALFEATGQYNTVDSAPLLGDVVTLLGAASTLFQPNLFWHKQAFAIGSVPMEKLDAQDSVGTTEDNLQIRVTRGSNFITNTNKIRFDLRPAYSVLNPFFAGQLWGSV